MQTQISELAQLQTVDMDAGQVFSGNPSGKLVKGYAQPSSYTPTIDTQYVFHECSRDLVVWLLDPQDPLYLYGPTGCGKTSAIKQLAARLNYPVFEVTGHGRLEFADMIGHLAVREGSMHFEYGPLALAMRYGGLFLLNEIDLTSPEVAAGLNTVLDGSPLCIAENGGELIQPHPMFRFVATANSSGLGDSTGMYQGVQQQNLAWLDRFVIVEMGYPDKKVEEKLLADRFSTIPVDVRKHMVRFANEVRKLFMGDGDAGSNQLEVTFSTRSLLRWADLTMRFQALASQGIQPIAYALDRAVAFKASRESRAMLHELVQRHFPMQQPVEKETKSKSSSPSIELMGDDAIQYLSAHIARVGLSQATIHLRKESTIANGVGSKDWVGIADAKQLEVKWGKTGKINQNRTFDVGNCVAGTPFNELEGRATLKIREGYRLLIRLCKFQ